MLGLPTTLPALKILSVRPLASWMFGTGLSDGLLERNRWHQPEVIVCVRTKACKTIFGANGTPGFVVEERRVLIDMARLAPCCSLTSSLQERFATR